MTTAKCCHAGYPVCPQAERTIADSLGPSRFRVEIVRMGRARTRVIEADAAGVRAFPAPVIDCVAYQVNFGASLADLA